MTKCVWIARLKIEITVYAETATEACRVANRALREEDIINDRDWKTEHVVDEDGNSNIRPGGCDFPVYGDEGEKTLDERIQEDIDRIRANEKNAKQRKLWGDERIALGGAE